ncbi:MAG: hypothetical protein ABJK28_16755 [Algibacter sp.]
MGFSLKIISLPYERSQEASFPEFLLIFLVMISAMLFILIVGWFFRKGPLSFNLIENQELDNYILNFDAKSVGQENNIDLKKVSISRKLVAYLLSVFLILIPLSECIENGLYSRWVRFMFW